MNEELKRKLLRLADLYEVSDFTKEDPSQFLRWYKPGAGGVEGSAGLADVEAAAFISAMLAFGSRKQFIPKITQILQTADRSSGSIGKWLETGAYKKDFPSGQNKFYRFYSYDDMQVFFGELAEILSEAGSLGEYFRIRWEDQTGQTRALHEIVAAAFPKSAIVPKGKSSANKRVHMFLRWMVRRNSPVDLGLWQWADPAYLLIPLDVHVMQEAAKLGLIPENPAASKKTAESLTAALAEVFPGDPSRGDYALFGLGVDSDNK